MLCELRLNFEFLEILFVLDDNIQSKYGHSDDCNRKATCPFLCPFLCYFYNKTWYGVSQKLQKYISYMIQDSREIEKDFVPRV